MQVTSSRSGVSGFSAPVVFHRRAFLIVNNEIPEVPVSDDS